MTDEARAAKVDRGRSATLRCLRRSLRSCMCAVRAMPCASCKDAASLLDTALADARREGAETLRAKGDALAKAARRYHQLDAIDVIEHYEECDANNCSLLTALAAWEERNGDSTEPRDA